MAFFDYRAAVQHDMEQFYLTLTKRIRRQFRRWKSSWVQVVSFSGFNCLSDDEPIQMTTTQFVTQQFRRAARYVALSHERYHDLRALRELSKLSDSTLKDIGFSRDDIESVRHLPLEMSPSDELNKIYLRIHGRLV